MEILIDEDMLARALVRLLQDKGHDVETVLDAGLAAQDDATVLDYARRSGRILLTRNARDFQALHEANGQHPGILIEYQDADPSKNMTYEQITEAIGKIEASGWGLEGQFASINAWR